MSIIKLVYNPLHFQGSRKAELKSMMDSFKTKNIKGDFIPLEHTGKAKEALSSNLGAVEAVIVTGGDGTLNLAVNLLLQVTTPATLPPMAVLPGGTANDFAGQLSGGDVRYSLEEVLSAIQSGRTCKVDVGQVNDRYFINVVGAGMLVDVAHKTSDSLKEKWGMMAYYYEALKHLFSYRPFNLVVREKGKSYQEEVLLALVLNGKGAGGFSRLVPPASFNDGKLDLLLLKNTGSAAGIASIFPRFLRGEHLEDDRLVYKQVEDLELHASAEVITDVDGEAGPPFPLFIAVHPGRLHFFTVGSTRRCWSRDVQ